jgi:hypothetical protein
VETREPKIYTLTSQTIYICPACGVINPAGPSGGCPHLQLVKFKGVGEQLEDLIMKVAIARKQFKDLVGELKAEVMDHVHDGSATVETPRNLKAAEAANMYSEAGADAFELTHPRREKTEPPKRKSPKHRKKSPPKVDERQLDLLAYSDPRANA